MKKIVIAGGSAYTDIDVLACAVAYRNCLQLQGKEAIAVLRAPFNETISRSILQWKLPILSDLPGPAESFEYVLVDVSDPDHFETFVLLDQVSEVLDHHFGYEEMWRKKLGSKGGVEPVGSCATLVSERFCQAGIQNDIGNLEANLLYTAIFANTLHLQAEVTTERDKQALQELRKHVSLPDDWIATYYCEVESAIFADPLRAAKKDTKVIDLHGETVRISQLELWDAKELVPAGAELLEEGKFLLLLSEISTRRTYFFCRDRELQERLLHAIPLRFESDIARADRLWMRKEVLRELQKRSELFSGSESYP